MSNDISYIELTTISNKILKDMTNVFLNSRRLYWTENGQIDRSVHDEIKLCMEILTNLLMCFCCTLSKITTIPKNEYINLFIEFAKEFIKNENIEHQH